MLEFNWKFRDGFKQEVEITQWNINRANVTVSGEVDCRDILDEICNSDINILDYLDTEEPGDILDKIDGTSIVDYAVDNYFDSLISKIDVDGFISQFDTKKIMDNLADDQIVDYVKADDDLILAIIESVGADRIRETIDQLGK